MKRFVFLVGFLALMLVVVNGLFAQQSQQPAGQTAQSADNSQMLITKAETLKGSEVYNKKGEKLGTVDSVALDLQSGKISYVSIDTGEGDKLVPVPFDMVGVTKGKTLTLNIEKNHFAKAPGVPKKNEPNWADSGWTNWVSSFWGAAPSGTMTAQTSGGRQQQKASSDIAQPRQMDVQQQQQPQQMPMGQPAPGHQAGPGQVSQQPMTGQQQPAPGQPSGQQSPQQPLGSQQSQQGTGGVQPGAPMGGQQQ